MHLSTPVRYKVIQYTKETSIPSLSSSIIYLYSDTIMKRHNYTFHWDGTYFSKPITQSTFRWENKIDTRHLQKHSTVSRCTSVFSLCADESQGEACKANYTWLCVCNGCGRFLAYTCKSCESTCNNSRDLAHAHCHWTISANAVAILSFEASASCLSQQSWRSVMHIANNYYTHGTASSTSFLSLFLPPSAKARKGLSSFKSLLSYATWCPLSQVRRLFLL